MREKKTNENKRKIRLFRKPLQSVIRDNGDVIFRDGGND